MMRAAFVLQQNSDINLLLDGHAEPLTVANTEHAIFEFHSRAATAIVCLMTLAHVAFDLRLTSPAPNCPFNDTPVHPSAAAPCSRDARKFYRYWFCPPRAARRALMVTDKFPDAMPPRIIQHDILM
jgi:hypothetical protein